MKTSLLKKWKRYATEERQLRRKALRMVPGSAEAMAARIEWTLALVALNRTERAIARAAYLDEFGVRPKVALVTRKRGAK